jgi:hypothetical protein
MDSKSEQVTSLRGVEDAADFHPFDRFNAFSDGVFAIVITLLVLELPVPPEGVPLRPALAASWPDFLGYAISFALVGGIWLYHAGLTKYLKRGDAVVLPPESGVATVRFATAILDPAHGYPHARRRDARSCGVVRPEPVRGDGYDDGTPVLRGARSLSGGK